MSHLSSFPIYQLESVIKFLFVDDVTNYKIYVGSTSKAMADEEKQRGRPKYKTLDISRTKRAF